MVLSVSSPCMGFNSNHKCITDTYFFSKHRNRSCSSAVPPIWKKKIYMETFQQYYSKSMSHSQNIPPGLFSCSGSGLVLGDL